MGYENHEVSILVTDDEAIRELNAAFRGKDEPTNVLAFPMMEGECSGINPGLLGDVAVSSETCLREAEAAGITPGERLSQLLIHAILHLVGFDHETGEKEALEMETRSLELLRLIEKNRALEAF